MDYKEQYKKALERARKLKENPQSVFNEYSPKEGDTICDYIFPELCESEDERIREQIIYAINKLNVPESEKSKLLAWLEKQESVGEIVARCKTSWYNEGKIQGQIEGLSDEEKYQQGWHDAFTKMMLKPQVDGFDTELKENEDGRVRKELINIMNLSYERGIAITKESRDRYIAWLEKQGKQKVSVVEFNAKIF